MPREGSEFFEEWLVHVYDDLRSGQVILDPSVLMDPLALEHAREFAPKALLPSSFTSILNTRDPYQLRRALRNFVWPMGWGVSPEFRRSTYELFHRPESSSFISELVAAAKSYEPYRASPEVLKKYLTTRDLDLNLDNPSDLAIGEILLYLSSSSTIIARSRRVFNILRDRGMSTLELSGRARVRLAEAEDRLRQQGQNIAGFFARKVHDPGRMTKLFIGTVCGLTAASVFVAGPLLAKAESFALTEIVTFVDP